jgi:hypothetical protein
VNKLGVEALGDVVFLRYTPAPGIEATLEVAESVTLAVVV